MVCVHDTGRWGLGPGALKIQEDIQYFTGLSNAVCILASASIIMSHNQDPWTGRGHLSGVRRVDASYDDSECTSA